MTHFNHRGILGFCPSTRKYATVEGMNEVLIGMWNATVMPKDSIWILGDFGFTRSDDAVRLEDIFDQLQGHKHLVTGNHDEKNTRVLRLAWESIQPLMTIRDGSGRKAELCHYPLETWKGAQSGALMLHGHCHGTLQRQLPHRFDVGVDAWGKNGPISFDALLLFASKQTYQPTDHHGQDL